jgi:hypothetical protein
VGSRWLAPADEEDGGIDARRRAEGAPGQGESGAHPVGAWCFLAGVLADDGALKDEVGRGEPGSGLQQQAQEVGGDPVGRVGHDAEPAPGQREAPGIRFDHRDAGEALAQERGAAGMQFDGDNPGSGADQVAGERAGTRADVEDELARSDLGRGDDAGGPLVIEPVPSPRRPAGPP